MRKGVFAVALLMAAGVLANPGAVQADPGTLSICESSGAINASALPATVPPSVCELVGRVVVDHGAGLTVGAPGTSVYTEEILATGWTQVFQATTLGDGTVVLSDVGDEAGSFADEDTGESTQPEDTLTPLGAPSPCNDEGHNEHGWSETDTHRWHFNRDSAPIYQPSGEPQMTKDEVEIALRDGTSDITNTDNSCGMEDNVRTTAADYMGDTNQRAQVTSGGDCDGNFEQDGTNAVDFGDLPDGKVGKMCKWTFPQVGDDELIQSDIRLNKVDYNWTLNPSASSCDNDYDIEGVMAHERGHTFGMAHVSEDAHEWLTMSTSVDAKCKSGVRSLGRGDVLGLRAIYGTN